MACIHFFFCLLFTLSLNNLKKVDSKCLELLKSAKCSVNHFSLYWALLTIFICIMLLTVASLITFQTYHKKVNHFNTLNQTPEIIVIVMNPSETSLLLSYPSAWSSRVISQSSIHEWATGLYPNKGYIEWITAKQSDTLQWKFSERSHSRIPALYVFMAPVIQSNQTSLNSASLEFDNDFN